MKRASCLFEQLCTYENLCSAWFKARRHKTNKNSVKKYSLKIKENLDNLQKLLLNNNYKLSPYTQFTIYDPKIRTISVVPFEQRVMHHAVINILEPIFERQFICNTFACRKGKGVHAALRKLQQLCYKRDSIFYVKLDVKKYFDSINHEILKIFLCRIIKDKKILELLYKIIDSYEVCTGAGLPIGNLTSQFFANLYLSSLDHYILEKLRPSGYVRYMDDMILLGSSYKQILGFYKRIEFFCTEKLFLSLKEPVINKVDSGILFLGRVLSKKNVRFSKKKTERKIKQLRKIQKKVESGFISEEKLIIRQSCIFSERLI